MSGDGTGYEYPDEAGYPDGMGTLHEGTDDAADSAGTGAGAPDAGQTDAEEAELDHFAIEDEEDDDEGV